MYNKIDFHSSIFHNCINYKTKPENTYAELKLEAEKALANIAKENPRIKLSIARVFSVSSNYIRKIKIFYLLEKIQYLINNKIVHISFDIDVFDPSLVKATGTRVDDGLDMNEVFNILFKDADPEICINNLMMRSLKKEN